MTSDIMTSPEPLEGLPLLFEPGRGMFGMFMMGFCSCARNLLAVLGRFGTPRRAVDASMAIAKVNKCEIDFIVGPSSGL